MFSKRHVLVLTKLLSALKLSKNDKIDQCTLMSCLFMEHFAIRVELQLNVAAFKCFNTLTRLKQLGLKVGLDSLPPIMHFKAYCIILLR